MRMDRMTVNEMAGRAGGVARVLPPVMVQACLGCERGEGMWDSFP